MPICTDCAAPIVKADTYTLEFDGCYRPLCHEHYHARVHHCTDCGAVVPRPYTTCKQCADKRKARAEKMAIGTRHNAELAAGVITSAGRRVIAEQLGEKGVYLPDDWGWVAKIGGKAEYVGTFAKRVGKYAHKRDIKLDSDFLGEIGSLVAQYTAKQTAYEFDFTNSFDWEAGDYGDGGSCFWGCRSGARVMLEENSGRAIRFYKDGEGYARAWLAPYENGWVCFNGYGLETITIAQVLSTHLGQTYKRMSLQNNGDTSGTLWINGGVGYYIGEEDAVQYNQRIDLEWGDEDSYTCANCGCSCGENDCTLVHDSYYCEDCVCELFSHCDHCGEWVDNDDITQVEDNWYCDHCRSRFCTECHECHEWRMDEDITQVDGDPVCSSCLENGEIPHCEHCGEYTREGEEVDDEFYCNDCLEDVPTCEKCGARHKELTSADGLEVCNDCLDGYEWNSEFGRYYPAGQLALEVA